MSPVTMLAAAALIYAIGWAADRIDARRMARQPANKNYPPGQRPGQSAHREPPAPQLTPAEQAMVAALAERYAHSDPRAGRQLADYLRQRCPGITDLDLMRCVVALGAAALYFRRHAAEADAFAQFLHVMSGAALDLTALERNEIPR